MGKREEGDPLPAGGEGGRRIEILVFGGKKGGFLLLARRKRGHVFRFFLVGEEKG